MPRVSLSRETRLQPGCGQSGEGVTESPSLAIALCSLRIADLAGRRRELVALSPMETRAAEPEGQSAGRGSQWRLRMRASARQTGFFASRALLDRESEGTGKAKPEAVRVEHGKVTKPVVPVRDRLLHWEAERLRDYPQRVHVTGEDANVRPRRPAR